MRTYTVVQVKDTDGAITFQVMRDKTIDEKLKDLKKKYVVAYRSYKKLKGEEKKQATKPQMPRIRRVLQFNKQEKATAMAEALQKQYDEKNKKDG